MDDHRDHPDELPPLTLAEIERTQEELRAVRERRRAKFERLSAQRKAAIELVKQQELLAARRRCWLF